MVKFATIYVDDAGHQHYTIASYNNNTGTVESIRDHIELIHTKR